MRTRTAIKWAHRFFTLFLLILIVAFLYLNHTGDSRAEDTLQHRYKINDNLWLYTTENSKGGATVPTVYRFYLTDEILGDNKNVIKKLEAEIPFITGSGSISEIQAVDNEHVNVVYSGKVYSLSREVSYSVAGHPVNLRISYKIN